MSSIHVGIEHLKDPEEITSRLRKKCVFCGKAAPRAFWTANTENGFVEVCEWCAIKHVLPKLIADAVAATPYNDPIEAWKIAESAYFKASTIAMRRLRKNEIDKANEETKPF